MRTGPITSAAAVRPSEFDAISELVYGPQTETSDDNSLISLIIDKTRVATNLMSKTNNSHRVLGSTIPERIQHTVMKNGKSWVGEVNTPGGDYLSAYKPLRDYQGRIVGMLEAGYLAAPLRQAYQRDLLLLALLLLLCVIGASTVAILAARRIFKPIERIAEVIHAQERGDDQRIGVINSRDEIGAVANRFDHMLDLLHERNAEIQRAADNLEQQVEARTLELQRKNTDLENTIEMLNKTRQQLVWAEKFAALGELTAGIAHEINNPTAVILGNMDVLGEELGDKLQPFETEVSLIYEQVSRIRAIIDNLLKYSRSSPVSQNLKMLDINALIKDSLLLVRHELARQHIDIQTKLEPGCHVRIDPQELQQVVLNLLINAIHAVSTNGYIEISTHNIDTDNICIRISDNGHGVEPGRIDRIFDPFFTTKGTDGTGLGLSISYGLVHRYGGNLEVDSFPGKGSTFTIQLRREPQFSPQHKFFLDLYSHSKTMRG